MSLPRLQVLPVAFAACISLFLIRPSVVSAQPSSRLPENWQQLSAKDFAYAVEPFYDTATNRPKGDFDEKAVRRHAANLFLQYDLANTPISDFPVIYRLYRAGWRELSDEQRDSMGKSVAARQDDWAGRTYEENLSKVMLMDWADIPFERMSQDVISFFDAGGKYEDVWPNDLQDYARLAVRDPKVVKGSFRVRWEGNVTAPQSGLYTFSVSEVNTSHVSGDYSLAQTMEVTLDGKKIISATPESWTHVASPVQLSAGKPAAIRVDFAVESNDLPKSAAHAILFWESKSTPRTVIPRDQLTVADGGKNGLQATYSWLADGAEVTISRVDPNVDFAWASSDVIVSGDSTIKEDLLARAWDKQTSPEFLQTLVKADGKVRMHSWTIDPHFSSQNLSSERRQAFLRLLLDRPELLDAYSARRIVGLYRAYRIGAPDTALDVFCRWALQNADYECELTPSVEEPLFDGSNREAFHTMAMSIVRELPTNPSQLQDEFLQMPDGRCCLPVAYTLGYSYLMRDKLETWIELLDAKLAQRSLVGDSRVNWLLARSHADEIRLGTRDPFSPLV
ncbi:MAG: PA14 domain-containing protein, partial [Planctomyces sp.]